MIGSPPQVRGKPELQAFTAKPKGITPAGAGKTVIMYSSFNPAKDHPRRCGENVQIPDV